MLHGYNYATQSNHNSNPKHRTLTAPVELIKCLKSIKEHAFSASPYPVILTLEVHLTPNLQAKVAKMVTQIFGNIFFQPNSESPKKFPSPEDLKMRIVVSTKPLKEYLESKSIKDNAQETQKEKPQSEEGLWGKEVSDLKLKLSIDSKNDIDQGEPDHHEEDDVDEGDDQSLVQNEARLGTQLIKQKSRMWTQKLEELFQTVQKVL